MSIVKWSNVRLKTKDKKIITGQIEEMVLSGSMNNIRKSLSQAQR